MSRFDYIRYNPTSTDISERFRGTFTDLESMIQQNLSHPQAARAKALILTKLEEAYMWVGKAIRDQQLALELTEHQP